CYFSITSYRPHPALHSFPTRRSSDLEQHQEYGQRHVVQTNLILQRVPGDSSRLRILQVLLTREPQVADEESFDPSRCFAHKQAQDRKSTRLNSSHVAISYAVFCLKKK